MNLQELIDKPGYGSAEIELRKSGKWILSAVEVLYEVPDDKCTDAVNRLIDKAINILEETETK